MFHVRTNRNLDDFKDIFEPRRKERSNFMYMSRNLNDLVSPYKQIARYTPTELKNETMNSRTIKYLIDMVNK